MLDIAIVGSGPAGLSAAISGVQRNKTVKVFGKKLSTSLLYTAENVDNYLGMPNVTGKEMLDNFYNHAVEKGVEFYEGRVLQIFPMGNKFSLNVENEFFEAKTIIITTGIAKGKTIKGEKEYLGSGVSYCATCDGMLYKNKTVVVIGETIEGEEDANFLSEICSKVYYVQLYNGILNLNENIEVIKEKPVEVIGSEFVSSVLFKENKIDCDGVFFIKETIPMASIINGIELENGFIKVNRFMETNIKNVFAAGDCTGRPFQVSKAVGEGLIAAQQAVKAIDEYKG